MMSVRVSVLSCGVASAIRMNSYMAMTESADLPFDTAMADFAASTKPQDTTKFVTRSVPIPHGKSAGEELPISHSYNDVKQNTCKITIPEGFEGGMEIAVKLPIVFNSKRFEPGQEIRLKSGVSPFPLVMCVQRKFNKARGIENCKVYDTTDGEKLTVPSRTVGKIVTTREDECDVEVGVGKNGNVVDFDDEDKIRTITLKNVQNEHMKAIDDSKAVTEAYQALKR